MNSGAPDSGTVDVALLPGLASVDGAAAVMVDVLRASTTMVAALGSGCGAVHPVEGVEAARLRAARIGGALLCGERGGVAPQGFDLGNSPCSCTPETVGGRELVLTTTNGTRALTRLDGAHDILIGSITNRAALSEVLAASGAPVVVVCAGTGGRVSLDDVIAAGLIVERLVDAGLRSTDAANTALHTAHNAIRIHGSIGEALGATAHGAYLVGLGFGADVGHAARLDSSGVVPRLDREAGVIRDR